MTKELDEIGTERTLRSGMSIYDGMYVTAVLVLLGFLSGGTFFLYSNWPVLFRIGFSFLHLAVYLQIPAVWCYQKQELDWFRFWKRGTAAAAIVMLMVFGTAFIVGF